MNMRPRSLPIFVVVGAVVWILVTVAVLIDVIQSPGEHVDLAIGVFLLWVAILVLVAMGRLTEHIDR